MMTRFVPAAMALMLLASPAMALPFEQHDNDRLTGDRFGREGPSTSLATMEQCRILESRFDDSVWRYKESPRLIHARELEAQGVRYCSSGDTLAGTADLKQALHILNKAPKA